MAGKKKISSWAVCKGLAGEILRDRSERRRFMTRLLVLVLAQLVLGVWVIHGWLGADVWRFLLWWAACGALTGFLLLMALYDMLAVIREERDRGDHE
ncbi:MAG: hypothetical protein J0M04_07140 [Verrucomicrobia bacterium]|nr:hypothetical protein [Verrucomicrobiota bacterium]